ncbi:MAG TPA: MlaD family protein [Chthoniobacterales bacterium]|jgi:paraquat-inducible protein B|nr:MlaD family protein [Chthoniobacterales bacterium]
MSQRANPTLIGAFVLGAAIIAVGAIVFFGSSNLFAKKQDFVTYFNQSVNGLGIGSNVKYKGVTVGKVTQLQLRFQGKNEPPVVRVQYEINTDNLRNKFGLALAIGNPEFHKRAIENGFRAKLDFESLISGQLYIALDFYKNAMPAALHPQEDNILEIPSLPSEIDTILANLTKAIGNLGSVDFVALATDLQEALKTVTKGINELQLDKLGNSLNNAANSISNLANGEQVKAALASVRQSFDELTTTLRNLDPSIKDLRPTLDAAKSALSNLQKSTAELTILLKPDSSLRYQLDNSLSQISAAAVAIQQLSDFLHRHPNSLIFGRKPDRATEP